MATLDTDFFTAIDEYMAQNGPKKTAGPYLATKLSELFDLDDAPLNASSETYTKLIDNIKNFYNRLADNVNRLLVMEAHIKLASKKIEELSKKLTKSNTFLDKFSEFGGKFNAKMIALTKSKSAEDKVIPVKIMNVDFIIKKIANIFKKDDNSGILSDKDEKRFYKHFAEMMREQNQDKKKPRVSVYSSNQTNTDSPGILRKLMGWVISAGALLGGAYVLSKFFNNTDLGKKIKEKIKLHTDQLGNWITKTLASGKVQEAFNESLKSIFKFFKWVATGLYKFFDRNKESIYGFIKDAFSMLGKAILKIPYAQMVWDKISSHLDFEKGGLMESIKSKLGSVFKALIPILGTWFVMRLIPVVNIPLKILEKLSKFSFVNLIRLAKLPFTGLFSLSRFLLANPLIAALTAAAASLGFLTYRLKGVIEGMILMKKVNEEIVESQQKTLATINKKLSATKQRVEAAKEKEKADPSKENFLNKKLEQYTESKQALLNRLQSEQAELQKKFTNSSNVFWTQSRLLEQQNEIARKYDKMFRNLDDKSNIKHLKDELDNIKRSKVTVNDAVIVEPHTKDQIMMGKMGGPFDTAFKDMVNKLDMMSAILGEGFSFVAKSNMAASNNVVRAVASTGGDSGGSAGTFSGSDPVRELRDRALRAIEGIDR